MFHYLCLCCRPLGWSSRLLFPLLSHFQLELMKIRERWWNSTNQRADHKLNHSCCHPCASRITVLAFWKWSPGRHQVNHNIKESHISNCLKDDVHDAWSRGPVVLDWSLPMITCMPRLARCLAVSNPIPLVPPVTMATLPFCLGRTV